MDEEGTSVVVQPTEIALVTGMSGAGRSTAARALEDIGWYVVENLPPRLIEPTLQELIRVGETHQVAFVTDVRVGQGFSSIPELIAKWRTDEKRLRVLYLEATDEMLVRRFESSRRPHPLQGSGRVLDGLAQERSALARIRAIADLVIDTSNLNVHDLRRKIEAAFQLDDDVKLRATVMSFGFKYGIPVDADMVADVRFLPNPFWEDSLRESTGLDAPVSDYVTKAPDARNFLDIYSELVNLVADGYLREGKQYVTIAVGCTGGKHRSVAMTEHLATRLVKQGVETLVVHRDLGRE